MSSLARRLTDVGPEGDALNVSPMTVLNWKSVDDPERHDTDEERRQWGRSPEPQERRFDRVDLASGGVDDLGELGDVHRVANADRDRPETAEHHQHTVGLDEHGVTIWGALSLIHI